MNEPSRDTGTIGYTRSRTKTKKTKTPHRKLERWTRLHQKLEKNSGGRDEHWTRRRKRYEKSFHFGKSFKKIDRKDCSDKKTEIEIQ